MCITNMNVSMMHVSVYIVHKLFYRWGLGGACNLLFKFSMVSLKGFIQWHMFEKSLWLWKGLNKSNCGGLLSAIYKSYCYELLTQ